MVRNINTTQWYFHYMSDILTTCIDLQWRYTILIFVLLYVARNGLILALYELHPPAAEGDKKFLEKRLKGVSF